MRVFRQLLIIIGLAVLALDLYMTQHGKHLCPYQGCRIVAATPFSTLKGYPLSIWGLAFFVVAFIFSFTPRILSWWVALGAGFSLYMVYLQVSVINRLCQMCILIEGIVFLLLLTLLRHIRAKDLCFLIAVGFLATHALYTFPPGYVDAKVAEAATWRGKGSYDLVFFFDPQCPACERNFKIMSKNKDLWRSVTFKSIAIHKGSAEKARFFYSLCREGMDPWKAFSLIHSGKMPKLERKLPWAKIKKMLEQNLETLENLGIDAVPVVVVKGESRRILVGWKEFSEWVEKNTKQVQEPVLFHPIEEGICTPHKECN